MKKNNYKRHWIALIIFALSLVVRLYYVNKIQGVSGGDAYNNLFIARYLANAQNPFEGARRLPFYPLLLVPTQFIEIDPIYYSRLVSVVLGSLIPVIIYYFSMEIGLNLLFSLLVATVTSLAPNSLFISLRPLSNSTFSLLAVLSVYLFYRLQKLKQNNFYVLSIILGLLSMTRHEGFIISGIILFTILLRYLNPNKLLTYLKSLTPYLLIISPFILFNIVKYKTPFYSDYLEYPEGLWSPHNLGEILRNASVFKAIFLNIWFSGIQFRIYQQAMLIIMAIGIYLFIRKDRELGIPILVILLSQALISFWFQPTIRYWHQIIPFMTVFIFYVFNYLRLNKVVLTILLVPISFILLKNVQSTKIFMNGTINELNRNTVEEFLLRQALQEMSNLKNVNIGLSVDYPQAVYFLGDSGRYYTTRPPKLDSIEVQKRWLVDNKIDYFIQTPSYKFMTIFEAYKFPVIKRYIYDKTEINIYEMKW